MSQQSGEQSLLRKYLLGGLDEGGRERVELRLLSDGEFAEEMAGVRQDLFEEYAAGALGAAEREGFERHCLNTHGARERLKFARALDRSVDERLKDSEAGSAADGARPSWFRRLFTGGWPRFAVPVAAALLLVVLYAAWQLWARRAPADDLRAALAPKILSLNTPAGGDAAPPVAGASHSVTLRRDIVRESQGLTRIAAPPGAEVLELRLVLAGEPDESYRAALLTDEDEEIASVGGLRAEGDGADRVLVFKLPARALPHGDYQLRVEGVGLYPFRVQSP